jgi:hypothetical protein
LNSGAFIRYNDGELFLHNATGFHGIDTNVSSVSAGFTLSGASPVAAAFILYNNGEVFEWAHDTGFHLIDRNAVSVAAASFDADTVFILYNNGQLFKHKGTSPVTGFTFIAGNVTSMAPTVGLGDVFYVQTNHMLSEHLNAGGSTVIDGNVQSVGQAPSLRDEVFVLYTNSALFEYASPVFTPIDTNVASVASALELGAFYVRRDGCLIEWLPPSSSSLSPDGTYVFVDDNVASISVTTVALDDDYIVYNNGMLFEHTGLSPRSGFTFIDSNVSP